MSATAKGVGRKITRCGACGREGFSDAADRNGNVFSDWRMCSCPLPKPMSAIPIPNGWLGVLTRKSRTERRG